VIDIVASGVLFDMDGTLVDSTSVVEGAWGRFGAAHDLAPSTILAFSHGRQTIDTVAHFLPDLDPAEQRRLADELVADEVENTHGIVEVPGAAAFLQRLVDAGVTVPDVVVTSEDIANGKPHPDGYLRGAELLGLAATDCLAFEDAPAGVESAIASGATTVVVGTLEADVTVGIPRVHGFDGVEVMPEGTAFRIRG
jgi:sugar-phosphatase